MPTQYEIDRATSELEAESKYTRFVSSDPFPEIAPSLLNSADISDYINTVGMICPYYSDNLKSATYGVKLRGDFIYWKNFSQRKFKKLENIKDRDENGDRVFTLERNSIAFVQLEPTFRFPDYIAARFNLKIKHIYQGLLLGTGPIIDPGYEGNIYVPLHNLTNNDYQINIDKPLIWMEFTKLSPNERWTKGFKRKSERTGEYQPFDKSRKNAKATLSDYLNDAHPNAPILSTIGGFKEEIYTAIDGFDGIIKEQKEFINKASDGASRTIAQFNYSIIIALVGIILTASYTIYQTVTIHNKAMEYMREYDKKLDDKFLKQDSEKIIITGLQEKVKRLEDKNSKKSK